MKEKHLTICSSWDEKDTRFSPFVVLGMKEKDPTVCSSWHEKDTELHLTVCSSWDGRETLTGCGCIDSGGRSYRREGLASNARTCQTHWCTFAHCKKTQKPYINITQKTHYSRYKTT